MNTHVMPKKHGPNMRKFIAMKMARDLVPPGGGIGTAISALVDPVRRHAGIADAVEWCEHTIAIMKTLAGNPFGDDDESIAAEVVKQTIAKIKAIKCK